MTLRKTTIHIQTLFLFAMLCTFISACSFENVRDLEDIKDTNYLSAFKEIEIIGGDNHWHQKYHPFIGATPIDIDGDGHMEIFVGSGDGYKDRLYSYRNNSLVNIIKGTKLSNRKATYGATSIDLDNDGDTDLLIARANGLFFYENQSGVFKRLSIPLNLPPDSVPFNVAVGDIDRDGDGDLYISVFVDFAHFKSTTYNDPSHAKTNIMLRNDGNLNFTDITEFSQTASLQNSFLGSFIDLNGDHWLDLVVAQNTGEIEIFRNTANGSGRFQRMPLASGFGFWMGLAVADIDRDGDQDLFFTNSGSSISAALLEFAGDSNKDQPLNFGWKLLRNDGDFIFTDVTQAYQLDDYGFAWGATFEDVTLDGEMELLVAQNYIKWFVHKFFKLDSKSFVFADGAFFQASALGLKNANFAQSPLIVDINSDGRPDVFWVNKVGNGKALLNQSQNNFLTLLFDDKVSSIGAEAYVETAEGKSHVRRILNNTGMSTDQQSMLVFGLADKTAVVRVVLIWPDGSRYDIDNPAINSAINVSDYQ